MRSWEREGLIERLRRRAREAPSRVAFTFLANGEVDEAGASSLTYAELERQAGRCAARLREELQPGDRALLLYPPGLEFIPAFLGCLWAGVVAVPIHAPRPNDRSAARLRSIADNAGVRAVLTTSALLTAGSRSYREAAPALGQALWWATDGAAPDAGLPELPATALDNLNDVAFLQYTSGSTSEPKGVLVTHGNLIHNEHMIGAAFAQDEDSLVVGWLPLFHDMGLIGQVLQPLWAGARCVLMAPTAFLQKPSRWLAAISHYRATTSGGPSFAYELCAAKIPPEALEGLDLSSWRVAFNGAEPVRAATLERFIERFQPYGFRPEAFYPCYGLAEATLFVSGGELGREPRIVRIDAAALERDEVVAAVGDAARTLVSSGHSWMQQRIAIVDPRSGEECPLDKVGEIWVAGPSVARGYWRQPEATERDFAARLRTPGGTTGPFLRTGDLGFLRDGELYVTGRLKDLIILRGRNHYPQDLELTAERSHPELRAGGGAAFSVEVQGEERLVIVHEVERHRRATSEEIAAAVRRAVAEGHEIQVHEVVLLRTGSLLRTTSGKVQRRACRAAYLEGSLTVVGRSALATGAAGEGAPAPVLAALDLFDRRDLLERFVCERAAAVLGVAAADVEPGQPLTALGLDSLSAIQLKGVLETTLGLPVPFEDLLAGVCIRDVVERLAAMKEAGGASGAPGEAGEAVVRTPSDGAPAPLSPGQKGLWLVDRLAPGEAALNIAVAARARGLDPGAFGRALGRVLARHEALRTVFTGLAGEPSQRVLQEAGPVFRSVDARDWSSEELARKLDAEAWAPFDLEAGPLLRVRLFERGTADPVLLFAVHHLVADFWSLALVARELGALVREEVGGPAAVLPPVEAAPRPADHVRWLERRLAGPRTERLWSFWQPRLAGLPDLDLPTDHPRPLALGWRGRSVSRVIPAPLVETLQKIGNGRSATLYMTFLAAFQAQLGRYSGQDAFAIGSPVAGRDRPELAGLVGYLVNLLPLRTDLSGTPGFLELLDRVRGTVLASVEHGDFPFQWMTERLGGVRGAARPPLYQAVFVFQRARPEDDPGLAAFALGREGARIDLGGIDLAAVSLDERRVQVEIGLWAAVDPGGRLTLALETRSDLFDAVTGERMLDHTVRLLAGAAAAPETPAAHLPLLGAGELHQLVAGWNDTAQPFPGDRCAYELFAARAALSPEAAAVASASEVWSYGELERRANRLAWRLIELGAGPEAPVGIHLERTPALVAGLLAAHKAGAYYVPLETSLPEDRLRVMAAAAGVRHILTERSLLERVTAWDGGRSRMVLAEEADEPGGPAGAPPRVAAPDDPAYVIFTSGSTGTPKGVVVRHRPVTNLIDWVNRTFAIGPGDRALFLASPGFDLSVYDVFGVLAAGGCVRVAAAWELAEPQRLLEILCREPVTFWNSAPAALQRLEPFFATPETTATSGSHLRLVFLSGDWIPVGLPAAVRRAFPRAAVVSLGGATEATVWSNVYAIGEVDPAWASIPYGRPIQNAQYYVLDSGLQPCPIGIAGDLYIGGLCLSDGYFGQPGLTAQAFLPDPFDDAGGRLYRTGDRARFQSDGNLEFLGRRDQQVKIRGHRIELGEIEAVLAGHPRVREAIAVVRSDSAGERRLVAYVVPATANEAPAAADLEALARRRLPEPMVPWAFVVLDALPLTANGKVDRKALPDPARGSGAAVVSGTPVTPVAELLALLWVEILGVASAGTGDDFFALGGHSLLAARLVARVRETLGVDLPLRDLFEAPTPAALAGRVEDLLRGDSPMPPRFERLPRPAEPPLSFAQERLWVLERMSPGNAAYHVAAALHISGTLDVAALAASLSEICRRHEVLRTRFAVHGEMPFQAIDPPTSLPLPLVDLAGCPEVLRLGEIARLAVAEARRPFDLERGPLFRVVLLRGGDTEHALLTTLHHAVCDGPSVELLIRELGALYAAFQGRAASALPEPALQYADFALWQRVLLPEIGAAQLAYWSRRLAGAPSLLELPVDRQRPAIAGFHGTALAVPLPSAEAAVAALAGRAGVTRFMAWIALFQVLLARASRQDDILVGIPFANRGRSEIADLIGLFVNTLVIRAHCPRELSARAFLGQVREAAVSAYAHADLPFERVLEEVQPERSLSYHPLFQVLFALERSTEDLLRGVFGASGLDLRLLPTTASAARLDLSLTVSEGAAGAVATAEYRTDLFDSATVVRMLGHLAQLAAAAAENPDAPLGGLPLLSAEELRQLAVWSTSAPADSTEQPVHRLIAERAAAAPDAPAVLCGDERLSYSELVRRATRLAGRLRRQGAGPETRVGVCLERSAEAVVALLAVFESGAAYVPLDPAYPAERLGFLAEDAGISLFVTDSLSAGRLPLAGRAAVVLDREEGGDGRDEIVEPVEPVETTADALAYIIYTSGSTGRPKGVAVEHRALSRVLISVLRAIDFGAGDSIPAIAPFSFDISLLEMIGPLLAGGTCHILPERPLDLPRLLALMGEVTFFHAVPALMRQVVAAVREEGAAGVARLGRLRTLLTGGDRVPPDLVEELRNAFPAARVRILYGPTEATIVCATALVPTAGPVEQALLGQPFPGAVLRLCDPDLAPVPQGVAGELLIGGAGVARGYWNRDELTRERFVLLDGERFYRSGDLARHLSDGALEFLGRTDQQVKIRGFRIDPGEVEEALRIDTGVREAVVVAADDSGGESRLVAYVVPSGGNPETELAERLRVHLSGHLPEFMIPSLFILLAELPLTPHGKVDRRALPAPGGTQISGRPYVAPATPLERELAAIFAEVLGVPRLGVHDDFFQLGGHSLLATRVMTRIRRRLGVEVPLRRLFELPTVARLAGGLSGAVAAGAGDGLQPAPPLVPSVRRGPAPLSFAQERLWFLDLMEPGGSVYNVSGLYRIEGSLPAAALELGLERVVRRHEPLRTRFAQWGGEPVQVVDPAGAWRLPVVDLAGLPAALREPELRRVAAGEAWRPFDLAAGPLLRSVLLEAGESGRALLLACHHIVSDAWSMGVLMRDLAAGLRAGAEELPPLPVLYADYAVWQRGWLTGPALTARLDYWRRQLAGVPPALMLPADRPRPAVQTYRGAFEPVELPPVLTDALRELARREGATPFLVLLAAFQTLLFRLTGEVDFCIGSPVSGRDRWEIEDLIGLFVNTLVLRTDLGGDPAFREVLARAREVALAAQAHQDLPLEMLIAALQPQRDLSHAPLFQVLFGFHDAPRSLELATARLVPIPLPAPTSKLDLSLLLSDAEGAIEGGLEYNTDLFERVTLQRIAGSLQNLLAAALDAPERPAAALSLLSAAQTHQVLEEWSATGPAPAGGELLHGLVASQALRTPAAVALIDGERRITYTELRERASLLASRLRSLGVGPETRVAVCSQRNAEMVISLLAVLEAGGAYVPLDPAYPAERLAFTLEDSRAAVLLTQRALRGSLPEAGAPVLLLDGDAFSPLETSAVRSPLSPGVLPGNLAYLIYTSGSTGRPKGVAIEHRSAVSFLHWVGEAFTNADLRGVLASTSICFDLSVFEIFAPLACGGAVILAADALALPGLPAAGEVTLVNTVPSAAAELVRLGGLPPGAGVVNLAGEPLRRELVEALYATPGVRAVLNLYGPSEDTTYSTFARIDRQDPRPPSIGRPVAGTRALALDAGLRLVPAGVTGELFLGGEGLARGYFDRPELTAERFIPDPTGPVGERLYSTGDLVRHRRDGSLEFLGRGDHQVKVRGFRIEMGEIEGALARHPALCEALVVAAEREPGGLGLIAYIVPACGEAPGTGELRKHLAQTLPSHMIPADFVVLTAIPRTPNGKVDRRALPAPDGGRAATDGAGAVRTPVEEIVADAWAEALGVPAVRAGDDFFELGGHSLLATRVISRLQERLGVELPLRALFQHPTVTSLALEVEWKLAAGKGPSLPPIERLPHGGPRPLSFAQERLLFFDRLNPGSPIYNMNGVFLLLGPLDAPALAAGLSAVVRRHESLRARFVDGAQVVLPPAEVPLPRLDLRALPARLRDAEAERQTVAEARLPFDLARGPLLRAFLLEMGEEHHLLAVTLHHIICDGWSLGVLIREALDVYAARVEGRLTELPELPVQYADFAAWQREWLRGEALAEQLAYWTRHLDGAPPSLTLPFDHPRPPRPGNRGGLHRFSVPPEVTSALKAFGRGKGTTLFMTLLAAWCLLLHRYSGQADIVVGSNIANRHRRSLEGLIGLLANTVALRVALHGDPSVRELLAQVREAVLGAHAHQDLPFEKLVEALQPDRGAAYHPIFQVMLVMLDPLPELSAAAGLLLRPVAVEHGSAKFDLTLFAVEEDGGIAAVLEYDADLFEAGTVADLATQLTALLEALPACVDEPISALPALTLTHEESLLGAFTEDLEL